MMVEAEVNNQFMLPEAASDAIAHAIVGAGESLANWWLDHPEVSRRDLAGWYITLVQSTVTGAVIAARAAR